MTILSENEKNLLDIFATSGEQVISGVTPQCSSDIIQLMQKGFICIYPNLEEGGSMAKMTPGGKDKYNTIMKSEF